MTTATASPLVSAPARSPLDDSECQAIAKRLFPDWATLPAIDSFETRYPPRPLPQGAAVTRVAPSPTGFAHIGVVYTSMINRRLAAQTGGVFLLRIEDTDSKREVAGASKTIIDALTIFDLSPQEGFVPVKGSADITEIGDYGPYLQSKRKEIYRAYAYHLVRNGLAYPCFADEAELKHMSELQRLEKARPGYYGRWAKWRDAALQSVVAELDQNHPFVIRLRSFGDPDRKATWTDGVKGRMALPENDLDAVILKSDGQSLYHLAHLIDDHLMRITHVIRGDEWISSVPLHLQIYQAFGWEPPHYSHLATIQKLATVTEVDEKTGESITRNVKRKLSKRHDPEANVDYYVQAGFPAEAVVEYLLNIANSDFEDWRKKNPAAPSTEFTLTLEKLNAAGALADMVKLTSISKDVVSRMTAEQIFERGSSWCRRFKPELANLMERDPAFTKRCLNIERGGTKPNKRIATWLDIESQIFWLFPDGYDSMPNFDFPEQCSVELRQAVIRRYAETYNPSHTREAWFAQCKVLAQELGFAAEMKEYKANPSAYKGSIGDFTMIIRVAISGVRQSPDLHEVSLVLGEPEVRRRLARWAKA